MTRAIAIPELGLLYEEKDNAVWAYLVKPYDSENLTWILTCGDTIEGNDFNALLFGKIVHKEELFEQFSRLKEAAHAQLDQKPAQ